MHSRMPDTDLPLRMGTRASMFLGDSQRRQNPDSGRWRWWRRGAGGQPGADSAVPRAARTERPAAARSRTAPHRATQRRTWPRSELELKGPAGARASEVCRSPPPLPSRPLG